MLIELRRLKFLRGFLKVVFFTFVVEALGSGLKTKRLFDFSRTCTVLDIFHFINDFLFESFFLALF